MRWILILDEFGINIKDIYGVDNIVAGTISRFPSTSVYTYNTFTKKDQCCGIDLFEVSMSENNKECFSLNLLDVQREQQKKPRN